MSDAEVREPRCRICRYEEIRVLVNALLDWRGVPVRMSDRQVRRVTYTDILGDLEPLNRDLYPWERITYASLWVHDKRHRELDGVVAHWSRRIDKELSKIARGPRP